MGIVVAERSAIRCNFHQPWMDSASCCCRGGDRSRFHVGVDIVMRVSPLYALTHPIGAVLFCYMLLRSTVVTLWTAVSLGGARFIHWTTSTRRGVTLSTLILASRCCGRPLRGKEPRQVTLLEAANAIAKLSSLPNSNFLGRFAHLPSSCFSNSASCCSLLTLAVAVSRAPRRWVS